MSDPGELIKAFRNMSLYTQDHLIASMRPELRKGVLEAKIILEKELLRLKNERADLENKLGIVKRSSLKETSSTGSMDKRSHSLIFDETVTSLPSKRGEPLDYEEPSSDKDVNSPGRVELRKPDGAIDIGRPYPVYVICYVCNQRVLTKTVEKSSGGCCLSCLTETPPLTVIHTCPLCHTFLGLYYDHLDEDSV